MDILDQDVVLVLWQLFSHCEVSLPLFEWPILTFLRAISRKFNPLTYFTMSFGHGWQFSLLFIDWAFHSLIPDTSHCFEMSQTCQLFHIKGVLFLLLFWTRSLFWCTWIAIKFSDCRLPYGGSHLYLLELILNSFILTWFPSCHTVWNVTWILSLLLIAFDKFFFDE